MHDLDWLREVLNLSKNFSQYLQQLRWEPLLMIATVVVGTTLAVTVLFITSVGRRKKMGRGLPAKAQEKVLLCDAIVSGIEEEVFAERLTRRRASFWYSWLGRELDLPDLLRHKEGKRLHPERIRRLKGAIQMRLDNGEYKTKVALPEPPLKKVLKGKSSVVAVK